MINENLRKRIHEANIEVHRIEANYYEFIHQEIFNKNEQERIVSTLKRVDKLIDDNNKKSLDFGAGTGNLTGKLLRMGYEVIAVDISKEMCEVLQEKYKNFVEDKKLRIISSKIEDMNFKEGEFDLISCYAVLHHLPDHVDIIQKLSFLLKKGGIMYLDHEASPFFWKESKVKTCFFISNMILNFFVKILYRASGLLENVPSLNYKMSDYWIEKTHHVEHDRIKKIFEEQNFQFFIREDYYPTITLPYYYLNFFYLRTKFLNPFFYIYKHLCKPDYSLWIAKK